MKRLAAREILLADGAMGTMLISEGIDSGDCMERINLTGPEVPEDIARRYFEAGADIVHTNTFGGSPLKLRTCGLDDQTEAVNREAVLAVRRAIGREAYLAVSCGPTGRMLKPYGDTDPEEMFTGFKRQLAAVVDLEVDLITVETMMDINEARLALKAAKDVSANIPVAVTMTFDRTERGFFTIMGADIRTVATELTKAGADIVGSNCGNGIEAMVEVAAEFRKYTKRPVLIQANAGLPMTEDGRIIYPETPEFMAAQAEKLVSLGVAIIGGCCGTTAEHIAAMRKMLDSHRA